VSFSCPQCGDVWVDHLETCRECRECGTAKPLAAEIRRLQAALTEPTASSTEAPTARFQMERQRLSGGGIAGPHPPLGWPDAVAVAARWVAVAAIVWALVYFLEGFR
jgi:hypothetical protein